MKEIKVGKTYVLRNGSLVSLARYDPRYAGFLSNDDKYTNIVWTKEGQAYKILGGESDEKYDLMHDFHYAPSGPTRIIQSTMLRQGSIVWLPFEVFGTDSNGTVTLHPTQTGDWENEVNFNHDELVMMMTNDGINIPLGEYEVIGKLDMFEDYQLDIGDTIEVVFSNVRSVVFVFHADNPLVGKMAPLDIMDKIKKKD